MKKLIVLAASLIALTALVVPAGAQAETKASNWTHNHQTLTGNVSIPLHGHVKFKGGTTCNNITTSIELFKGGSTGQVLSYAIPSPGLCEVTETLKALGCTGLTASTPAPVGGGPNLAWPIHNQFTDVTITGSEILSHFTGGGFCPKTVTWSGEVTAVPDNTKTFRHLTLHGTLNTSLGTNADIEGTLTITNASQAATYGLH